MLTLIANLGSTSFKYKLFDMPSETVLATGASDRIGQAGGAWDVAVGDEELQGQVDQADHAASIDLHLAKLRELGVEGIDDLQAIGFKAVHGGPISGAVPVDDQVLATMEQFIPLAPAHNPPYIAAMKSFKQKLPGVKQVAAFETAFHQTIPASRQTYAIPWEWTQAGIRRYGFHGASHRYIATRVAELMHDARKVITLHLGGSSSVCAVKDGKSMANSFGTTPQTGLPHNNRVGEFDPFAWQMLKTQGVTEDDYFHGLAKQGGLLGISGVSPDMRDIEQAMADGNERAQLAFDAFVEACRHYVWAYLAVLGGADAIAFTGGIGQHGNEFRQAVCRDIGSAGIELDTDKNASAKGSQESRVDATDSKTAIWVLPTNEELIVARQTYDVLNNA